MRGETSLRRYRNNIDNNDDEVKIHSGGIFLRVNQTLRYITRHCKSFPYIVAIVLGLVLLLIIVLNCGMHRLPYPIPSGATDNLSIHYTNTVLPVSTEGHLLTGRQKSSRYTSLDGRQIPYKPLLTILKRWSLKDLTPPDDAADFDILPLLDYLKEEDRAVALKYREAELPFKLYNIPEIVHASSKWTDEYLSINLAKLNNTHVDRSDNSRFLYFERKRVAKYVLLHRDYEIPPGNTVNITFSDWLKAAKAAEVNKIGDNVEHLYYFAATGSKNFNSSFISRDLPIFSTSVENLFVGSVKDRVGIGCRFGMRGNSAEAHTDGGRNMVAVIKGSRRYILTPPWTCSKLSIINDTKHPSFRQSMIDWSNIKMAEANNFSDVAAINTIVKSGKVIFLSLYAYDVKKVNVDSLCLIGEVLYIPPFWFHYVVLLNLSYQCNVRSGMPLNSSSAIIIENCLGSNVGFKHSKHQPNRLRGART